MIRPCRSSLPPRKRSGNGYRLSNPTRAGAGVAVLAEPYFKDVYNAYITNPQWKQNMGRGIHGYEAAAGDFLDSFPNDPLAERDPA